MKIFAIHHNNNGCECNKSEQSAFISYSESGRASVFYTLPDTAVTRPGRPFFIPDFAEPCAWELHLVVRICRLGKNIPVRFAYRYYDAMTVGVLFSAQTLLDDCRRNGLPWEIATGFDGAACMGDMSMLNEKGKWPEIISLKENGVLRQSGSLTGIEDTIDFWISKLSQFYTMRQGDLLYTGNVGTPAIAKMDSQLTGWLDDEEVMTFKVK